MLDRHQLQTFATVIEEQSFERAAALLNITKGAVSQRVKALEESLATMLVLRERPISPTPAGEKLLRHVQALRMLEDATIRALSGTPGRGDALPVSIAVNADSLATWFPRMLWPLMLDRAVALEVVVDDQDHTLARMARGEVIGCISAEPRAATGFVANPLGSMEYRCFATRGFAREYFPDGITARAAREAPAVVFNRKDSLHDDFLQSLFGFRIDRYVKHYLPASTTLLEGIRMGIGYGLVPSEQLITSLDAAHDLIDLRADHPVLVPLYWHHWEFEPPLSSEITRRVVAAARERLIPPA